MHIQTCTTTASIFSVWEKRKEFPVNFLVHLYCLTQTLQKRRKRRKKKQQPNVIKTSIEPAQMCPMVSVEFQSLAFTNEVKT